MTATTISDAEIVAFLDDQLSSEDSARIALAATQSPDVAQRIEALSLNRDQLTSAFDTLLEKSPEIPVEATDTNAPNQQPVLTPVVTAQKEPVEPANIPARPSRWRQTAAAAVLLCIGVAAGTQLPTQSAQGWHLAVADYQVLYATETLTGMALTEDQRWGSLSNTSKALGLDLSQQDVTLAGLEFRRAQILNHNGAPLAQLAFLDGDGNAIAFCFTRTNGPDRAAEITELAGLGTVTWQTGGMGFILIGGADQDRLLNWQSKLAAHANI